MGKRAVIQPGYGKGKQKSPQRLCCNRAAAKRSITHYRQNFQKVGAVSAALACQADISLLMLLPRHFLAGAHARACCMHGSSGPRSASSRTRARGDFFGLPWRARTPCCDCQRACICCARTQPGPPHAPTLLLASTQSRISISVLLASLQKYAPVRRSSNACSLSHQLSHSHRPTSRPTSPYTPVTAGEFCL